MSEVPLSIVSGPLTTHQNASESQSTPPSNNPTSNTNPKKGWLMVGLVFIANFLVFGFFKSLGMLTKILNREFGSTMNVYILMCITYSLNCIAGPLSCYLTRRYSARAIALLGTSMVTFGLVLSWFARSLLFLYFSMGVLTGIGSGLTYPTGVILVSKYFIGTKNAGIANALVVSGSPIGGMIMPFVISYLSELYTSRGAFLIIGGVMVNAILCARAFRPPSEDAKEAPPTADEAAGDANVAPRPPSSLFPGDERCAKMDDDSTIYDEENNAKNPNVHSCSTGMLTVTAKHERLCRQCGNSSSVQTVREYRTCHSTSTPPSSPFPLEGSPNGNLTIATSSICSNPLTSSVKGLNYRRKGVTNIMLTSTDNPTNAKPTCTLTVPIPPPPTGSQPYILSMDHSCIILCPSKTDIILKKPVNFAESLTVGSNSSTFTTLAETEVTSKPDPSPNCKWISPLGKPIYVFLLISNTASAISTANIYLILSQLVTDDSASNYTKTSIVYLLFSSADLSGRILGAFLCDKHWTSPSFIYATGLVTAGLSSSALSILPTYLYLCIGTFSYGLASGLHVGIFGLLLANIVGIRKIHAGYGIVMFINGTIQCAAILLSGRIISQYQSCFQWLAPVFGGILGGGGIIWIIGCLIFYQTTNLTENKNSATVQQPIIIDENNNMVDCQEIGEDSVNNNKHDDK